MNDRQQALLASIEAFLAANVALDPATAEAAEPGAEIEYVPFNVTIPSALFEPGDTVDRAGYRYTAAQVVPSSFKPGGFGAHITITKL